MLIVETCHVKAFRASKLKPGEVILASMTGWIGDLMGKGKESQHNGAFILTDLRVCFYRKGIFGEVFETIPISKLSSVESLSRLGYRVLRLHTSNDELVFKTFDKKKHFNGVYEALEEVREAYSIQTPTKRSSESVMDQLKKLGELRDAGVLTESEFVEKKRELLGRM